VTWVWKIVRVVGILLVLVVVGFVVFVATRQHLRFDRPYPAVVATTDSAVVERGRYVVRNLAQCGACHGDPSAGNTVAIDTLPLSGGNEWHIPPGTFRARNITPDSATGIGAYPDGAVARALRYGVGHDGRALLPFMEMQGLSDDDLTAVVSYLRTQTAVSHAVPMHDYSLLGRIVRATVLANPVGPAAPPPARAPHGPTVENGRYLAGAVANCWGCHTQRNMATGALMTPKFSGSTDMGEGETQIWAPPNLTPDPATGRLMKMSEDQFVARIRAGRAIPGSPMPWDAYRLLQEDDLRAIYRFLMTLPPVVHDTGPSVRPRS
jgi:cytochrome c553